MNIEVAPETIAEIERLKQHWGVSSTTDVLKIALKRGALIDLEPHGCFCDLEPQMEPDGCVIDDGLHDQCVYAGGLASKWQCQYWRPLTSKREDRDE